MPLVCFVSIDKRDDICYAIGDRAKETAILCKIRRGVFTILVIIFCLDLLLPLHSNLQLHIEYRYTAIARHPTISAPNSHDRR